MLRISNKCLYLFRGKHTDNKHLHGYSVSSHCESQTWQTHFKLHKAFTLVEILITLGIIGVVAAITIPTLIQNSNSKKFVTQFKKSLSTLSQAAISAQAQYDMDYSLLTVANEDSSCATDTLASGKYSLCGLFNNTLTGHTYQGEYGTVKGADNTNVYQAGVTSFSVDNFLLFAFADGAVVGFNPNATNCSVGTGFTITTDMVTTGRLKNCLGFIDVNGVNPPNKEVQCADGDTVISTNTVCKVTNGSMGDIFPIVFHDGSVEPATNASLSAFLDGNGKEIIANNVSENLPKKINFNGQEYEFNSELGSYIRKNDNGDYVTSDGIVYKKLSNGNYQRNISNYSDVYDGDLNYLGRNYKGMWYDYMGETLLHNNGNGTYSGTGGGLFTQNSDGTWVNNNGYVLDENFNTVGRNYNNNWYDYKNGNYVRELDNGNIASIDWKTYKVYTKNSDGYYVNSNIYYDKDLNILGQRKNNVWYDYKGSVYVHNNGDGTYNGVGGETYTKNSSGYYVGSNGKIYDNEFNYIGQN